MSPSIALAVAAALAITARAPAAAAKGCHETSYVVGIQHCSSFGMWSRDGSMPRIWIDIGYFHHRFDSEPFMLDRSALSTKSSEPLATTANGLAIRVLGSLGRWAYTGGELEAGGLGVEPPVLAPAPVYSDFFGMHAIAGVHVSLFRFGLASELAGGFRYDSIGAGSQKLGTAVSASQDRRELELRFRADLFLVPHLSVGVTVGHSLIDHDNSTVLVTAAIHGRAMDGMW